jgi:hypothetical protein
MVKMRLRQGHALQLAMDLNLHRSDASLRLPIDQEWTRDMRRRTWWIAFGQLCQASVMSGIPPSLAPFDPRITAEFPACRIDPEVRSSSLLLRACGQTSRDVSLLRPG